LNLRKFYVLSERGVSAQGQITRTEPENHGAIHYSFSVRQQTYSGIGGAGDMHRKFDEVTVGDAVPVVYEPADPETSCLGDADKQFTSLKHGVFAAPHYKAMNSFRELVEQLHAAHSDFSNVWKAHARHRKTAPEPQPVTDSRDKFWAALNALFGKLTPLEELFLAGDPAAIDAVLEFAEVLL
jgi:hypothetical protein